jgi:predicted outer membrane repeat protein
MKSLTLMTLGLALAGSALATDLEITVETDKPVYAFGEDVNVSVTAFNPTDSPITLGFASSCQASYLIDDWYFYSQSCTWGFTHVTIEPNESHTWTMVHDSYQRHTCPLRPGSHSVVGIMRGYTEPIEFEVVGELPEIHVATDGNDLTGDGTSQYPFRTIQKGVDTAVPGSDVIVMSGTYTGSGNRDISFDNKGLNLRSQTGPQDCTIDCNGSPAEPHRAFYFNYWEGLESIVDGFTITNGHADLGGAFLCVHSDPKITNCIFTANSAGVGGAIALVDGYVGPIVNNCIITGNSAQDGAGLYCSESKLALTDCSFTGNSATNLGGAVYIVDEQPQQAGPEITDCTFVDNSATAGGGAIFNSLTNPTLSSCMFQTNSAYRGAAIANNQSNPDVKNCIFTANIAARGGGGGMYNSGGCHPEIINCTFAANEGGIAGGVLMASGGSAQLANCIFYNNQPRQVWGTAAVSYTNIQGGWEGDGNIDADPCFADPCNGDYHLKSQAGRWDPNTQSWVIDDATSACIDAGGPGLDFGAEPYPNGGRINMGAYGGTDHASKSPWITCWEAAECPGQPFGDASCDGAIGLADLFALKAHFATTAPWLDNQCCTDLNHDNAINLADLFIFRANYGSLGHTPSTLNQACPPS